MSAPPGYNPSVSLLQGGTAPIVAVQGGGGAPAGYNASVSLLDGGNSAPIVGVMGGGGTETVLEIYDITDTRFPEAQSTFMQDMRSLRSEDIDWKINKWKFELSASYQAYKKTREATWHQVLNEMRAPTPRTLFPTFENPGEVGKNIPLPSFPKLGLVLSELTERFIVLPRISGDPEKFLNCIEYLIMRGVLREDTVGGRAQLRVVENTVIICQSPFYGPIQPGQENDLAFLFYIFLRIVSNNPDSFYVLTEHNRNNMLVGKQLYQIFDYLNTDNKGILPIFMEPAYLFFPTGVGKFTSGLFFSAEYNTRISAQPRQILSTMTGYVYSPIMNTEGIDAEWLGHLWEFKPRGSEIRREFDERWRDACNEIRTFININSTNPPCQLANNLQILQIRRNADDIPEHCRPEPIPAPGPVAPEPASGEPGTEFNIRDPDYIPPPIPPNPTGPPRPPPGPEPGSGEPQTDFNIADPDYIPPPLPPNPTGPYFPDAPLGEGVPTGPQFPVPPLGQGVPTGPYFPDAPLGEGVPTEAEEGPTGPEGGPTGPTGPKVRLPVTGDIVPGPEPNPFYPRRRPRRPTPPPGEPTEKRGLEKFRTTINGRLVVLRLPTAENIKEWKEGKFIKSEYDFLEMLHLTPTTMPDVFSDAAGTWQEEIARFLENFISYSCYSDVSLLTKTECMTTRNFLNKVYTYLAAKNISTEAFFSGEAADLDIEEVPDSVFVESWKRERPLVKIPMDAQGNRIINLILINRSKQNYLFKKITIPADDAKTEEQYHEDAMKRIDELKARFPNYLFLY
jgi:hypothetical protein